MATEVKNFGSTPHGSRLEELINSSFEILFLELTERCNLRCEYCIYNSHVKDKRDHGNKGISLPIIYRAIDYLNKHSFKNKEVAIGFYGGEPLLEFSLLKKSVEYAKTIIKKDIIFSITTNGILINTKIAEFLFKNNFEVNISIDGPQEIHDSYRKGINGDGSFRKSINGLKRLVDIYGNSVKDKIKLTMVYTPPFSENRINRISETWDEIKWLPQEIGVMITYPVRGTIPLSRISLDDTKEDKDLRQWAYEKYKHKYKVDGRSHPIANSIIEPLLAQLMQRTIYNEPCDIYSLNGCCVPGVRRIYVSTNGTFHICERISYYAPTIGNVFSGIDINKIKKIYVDEYKKISYPLCSKCWAIHLCNSCYIDVIKDGELDQDTKKKNCAHFKNTCERDLKFFCSLMEIDKNGLDQYYNFKLK